jgi:Flp pilus assembly pilin Flp
MFVRNLANVVRKFHNDEDGMEAVQGVMIAAIGAVVLAVLYTKWDKTIKPWFDGKIAAVLR